MTRACRPLLASLTLGLFALPALADHHEEPTVQAQSLEEQ